MIVLIPRQRTLVNVLLVGIEVAVKVLKAVNVYLFDRCFVRTVAGGKTCEFVNL